MKSYPGGPTGPAGLTSPTATMRAEQAAGPDGRDAASAEAGVTALYQAHALGLIRLAHIMLDDRANAEDVVQEAFCGLYRRWSHLSDTGERPERRPGPSATVMWPRTASSSAC
jgi:Sigma-70 region 2